MINEEYRYPIGKFSYREPTVQLRKECIAQFIEAPKELKKAVDRLNEKQLLTPYREGGWTIAQVVHHLAEADVNAYPRMKYALTLNTPKVLVADEAKWAELPDARSEMIDLSLKLFESIRYRWAQAWEALENDQYNTKWEHAHFGIVALDHILQQYAWHAKHHTAQIMSLRKRMGW